jgi:hypothetical protein
MAESLTIGDLDLRAKIVKLIEARQVVVVRAESNFKHLTEFKAMLTAMQGGIDVRSSLAAFRDTWRFRDFLGGLAVALERAQYTWRIEQTADGVAVYLQPPPSS